MTHTEISFENPQQALSLGGEKLATEAINEIRTAINQAVAQAATATDVDTLLQTTIEAAQTARREKAAAAAAQAIAFLCDNPALPKPRAQRGALERLRRKLFRRLHSEKV